MEKFRPQYDEKERDWIKLNGKLYLYKSGFKENKQKK